MKRTENSVFSLVCAQQIRMDNHAAQCMHGPSVCILPKNYAGKLRGYTSFWWYISDPCNKWSVNEVRCNRIHAPELVAFEFVDLGFQRGMSKGVGGRFFATVHALCAVNTHKLILVFIPGNNSTTFSNQCRSVLDLAIPNTVLIQHRTNRISL